MKLARFEESREARWAELEELVRRAGSRADRLSPGEVRRLAGLYRSAAADLAIARREFPGERVVGRLEEIVIKARGLIYERVTRRGSVGAFIADAYWQLVATRIRVVGLAAVLLVVPGVVAFAWATSDPELVAGLVPPEFLWVQSAATTDQGYDIPGLIGFSTFVMANNIRVTLIAFALGLTWGLGTAWVTLQNGWMLGAVAGLAVAAGNVDVLLAAVMAHGVLELSCIVVGAGAGLSVGRATLRPGKLTRREAFGREALTAAKIAVGTLPWLVVAGLLEGFASRTGRGPVFGTIVGLAVGGTFWGLVWWRGRGPRARSTEPAVPAPEVDQRVGEVGQGDLLDRPQQEPLIPGG